MNGARIAAFLAAITLAVPGCTSLDQHRDTVGGVLIGCAAGYGACLLAKGNPAACALACVAGGAVGAGVGAYLDNRRHKLEEAARVSGLQVSFADVTIPIATIDVNPNDVDKPSVLGAPSTPTRRATTPKADGLVTEINVDEMFPEGSSQLTPLAREKLSAIAKVYAQRTNKLGVPIDTSLLITGHTDAVGTPNFNQRLSEQRARTVAALFVASGVPATALYVKGAGSAEPIAGNNTAAGRALNRRVEILEVDKVQNLVAYAVARRRELRNVEFSTGSESSATARSAYPNLRPRDEAPRSGSRGEVYAFGGAPASTSEPDLAQALGPTAHRFSWRFTPIAEAQADEPLRPCYFDQPRVDGDVYRYAGGEKVESHETSDYLPGMFGGGWGGPVGSSELGIMPVAVLREDALSVGSPKVLIQSSSQHTPTTYPAVVNTYEGQKAVLYRVYLMGQNAPVSCIDLALPKSQPFKSQAGYIFYRDGGPPDTWKQAIFHPALINSNE